MLVRAFAIFTAATIVLLSLGMPAPLQAAEFTDLLDAADDFDDNDDSTFKAWDFHLEPSFRFETATAEITREAPCVPRAPGAGDLAATNPRLIVDSDRCDEPRITHNQEMDFAQTSSILDITLRAGLYKDLELRVNIPYVFSSTRTLGYADQVDENNSSVDTTERRIRQHAEDIFQQGQSASGYTTSLDQFQLFRLIDFAEQDSTIERSGLGDPSLGIHWAPWNDQRDDTKATMLIGMDYVMPVAEIQKADNTAVGRGVHELQWKVAASKRFAWFEPYFGAQYFLPLPATGSLYGRTDRIQNQGQGQVLHNPPQRGLFTVGTEIIPYEDEERGMRYAFDLRFRFGYTSEGRDYSPLFDHLTDPNNPCNGMTIDQVRPQFNDEGRISNPKEVACAWVIRQPSNAGGQNTAEYNLADAIERGSTEEFSFTDLMTVDSHAVFGGEIGVSLQPSSYFQLRGVVGLTHRQSHLLTNARTGRNHPDSGDDSVSMTDVRERNPAYNPSYDNSGNRFRAQRYNTWHFMMTTALQF